MLLAAGGLDNVMCVTGFSVFLGIIFSEGKLVLLYGAFICLTKIKLTGQVGAPVVQLV